MSKRRKFSVEFKRGAVEQASQPGVRTQQIFPIATLADMQQPLELAK